ncbi:MAG: hypothetical protein JSW11_08020 [Candidatus Heimdallarchaeota archaeon]|nr:MAG: hypothetical protein JSW11_08020 [Candidatus Heimdallarchaeota archaeon]
MEKEKIPQIIIGIFIVFCISIIMVMIFFADFWLPLLTDPSISYISIAYILLPLTILVLTSGVIIWKKFFVLPRGKTLESRLETRNVKIGLCLGSLTNKGTRILGRSEYCPFNEPQLHSMLEYSAVSVLHGDIGSIIGPFPMRNSSQEEMHYVSYGFRIKDRLYDFKALETYLKDGGVLGIFLLYYPEQLDSSILLKKKLIMNSFKSATNNISQVSDLIPEKIARIEEDIQFLSLF